MKRLMILLVAVVLTVAAEPVRAQAPDSPIMINHYGNLAMEKGDYDQAIDDFKRACSAGLSAGCGNVYEALFNKGLAAMQGGDNAKALQSFQQSCQGNVADACHNLGVYYQAGVSGAVNINQARMFYTKACGLGQKQSCENLALLDGQGPSAPQPPQSPPSQSVSAPAATGDVFGKCVSLHAEEKRGIQDYWSLSNDCNVPVIVRYCFKANFETAGNEGLCSQLEFRTNEIKANSKLDFTFSLEDPGTPRTDGTISGANSLTVFGFACTDGMFPQVSFEDKRLKFLSCS